MSRRPPSSPEEDLARAVGRMAPGGRMWSESPIPRYAIRKIRAAGVEPVRFYVEDCGPGTAQNTYWNMRWWSLPLAEGWYEFTTVMPLTAVDADATQIRMTASWATWVPPPGWLGGTSRDFLLSGGPWSVGDVLSTTIQAYYYGTYVTYTIYSEPEWTAPFQVMEWAFDCPAVYLTAKPIPDPAALTDDGMPG